MTWTQHISDCRFKLDLVRLTITSKKPQKLVGDLSKYMQKGKTFPENKTKRPVMPDTFRHRTYFNYGPFKDVCLLHEKITAKQGMDALLVIHDVTLVSLLQIEQILFQISSVTDFHFCRIEFTWDFYPGPKITASKLQKKIVRLLHITHARKAWYIANKDRITYYIGNRKSDLQVKVYVRPKEPNPTAIEFTRVELTAKTRWLKKHTGLIKPSDFLKLKFQRIIRQVRWLEFDWHELRRSNQHHLLSGGEWTARLANEGHYLGICHCLTEYRNQNVCPAQCKARGNPKICRLLKAYSQQMVGTDLIHQIQNCPRTKAYPRFEEKFCKQSRHSQFLMKMMEQAYLNWNQPPLFPVKVTSSTVKTKKGQSFGKRKYPLNQKRRKGGKKKKKQKPKIVLYDLFKNTI